MGVCVCVCLCCWGGRVSGRVSSSRWKVKVLNISLKLLFFFWRLKIMGRCLIVILG